MRCTESWTNVGREGLLYRTRASVALLWGLLFFAYDMISYYSVLFVNLCYPTLYFRHLYILSWLY